MSDRQNYLWFLPILSGFLLGIGFLFPALRFTAWFGLIPLFFFLDKNSSPKKSFLVGFLAGLIFCGQVGSWILDSAPLTWIQIESQFLSFVLVFSIWLFWVVFASVFFGLFVVAYQKFRTKGWLFLFSIPCLWVILEYLKAWGLTLLLAGKESALGPHWTFGNLGYLLSGSPFLGEIAGLGGLYLLSFLVVFFNTVFYWLFGKFRSGRQAEVVFFIIVLAVFSLFLSGYLFSPLAETQSSRSLKVAVVNTQFADKEKKENKFSVLQGLLLDIARLSDSPKAIILPEGASFLVFAPEVAETFLKEHFSSETTLIIDAGKYASSGNPKNRITFFDAREGLLGYQDKLFLMSFGEYLPHIIQWPTKVFFREWWEGYNRSRNFGKGEGINKVSFSGTEIGGFLCGEIISPELYRRLSAEAGVVFNMGNFSSFGRSPILSRQIQAMAQLRAAENNRYLVRAANADFSYIIDNRGRVVVRTQGEENQVLFGEVEPSFQRSIYNRFGDWFLIVALLFLLLIKLKIKSIPY